METKRFELRVLLTITTSRLLTKSPGPDDNGIGDLYDILGWMTNDQPFTHQLPRFAEECKPWLMRWFPGLKAGAVGLPLLDAAIAEHGGKIGCEKWLGMLELAGLPRDYDVPRIPRDDHDRKHPYDELVAMRGTDDGIVVIKEPANGKA